MSGVCSNLLPIDMALDCRIRPLIPADEPFLRQMLYHAIYVPPGQAGPPPDIVERPELARYVRGWGRVGDGGLLAYDAATGQPVGAAWLRLWGGEDQGYGHVADDIPELSMAVVPECRGRGIGTQLLTQLLEAAGAYPAVSLSVSPGNPARRLYERCGFRVVGLRNGALTLWRGA